MLFGNESISHYTRPNIVVWMTLAFQAGMLNIGGFMACGRFVSHVTGFAAFFGYELGAGHYDPAIGMLLVPIFFLFGAMLSGWLVDLRLRLHKKPNYYVAFGVIFALIFLSLVAGVLGAFGAFGASLDETQGHLLLALLCLTCGVQNGTITTVSRAVIRTTHLTGITTDLGIGFVRLLNRARLGEALGDEERANSMRIGIIAFFTLGSACGGVIFHRFGFYGFAAPLLTSGALFGVTFYYQVLRASARARSVVSSSSR